jgi:hypothetical protein
MISSSEEAERILSLKEGWHIVMEKDRDELTGQVVIILLIDLLTMVCVAIRPFAAIDLSMPLVINVSTVICVGHMCNMIQPEYHRS